MEIHVGKAADLAEGQRLFVEHKGRKIGILKVQGVLKAFLNQCPHQGGPVCEGVLVHRVKEVLGEDNTYRGMTHTDDLNLVCPWHGWEFDASTGQSMGDGRHRLKSFEVAEKEGEIGRVAQINCNSERALPETDFRRCVRNAGGQVRSSGSELGRQSWLLFSDFRWCAPLAWAR